jgi:phosphatidate cytidylyltransferase
MSASETSTPPPKIEIDNFVLRLITTAVLVPLTLFITYLGGVLFLAMLIVMMIIGTLEFYRMEQERYEEANTILGLICAVTVAIAFFLQLSWLAPLVFIVGAVVAFTLELFRTKQLRTSIMRVFTTLGGVLYVAVPVGCLLAIRNIPEQGAVWVIAVYLSTWATDSIAYLVGRKFGKTPLAPTLSPKKSREGAIGGAIGGIIFPLGWLILAQQADWNVLIVLCVAPLLAIWGDLFESALKRFFGVKDSGIKGLNLFPGHGGVLDRVDALLWVIVLYYGYLVWIGKVGF